jgi:tripartite-type tricarboxylate transporter receptor subunit TctC
VAEQGFAGFDSGAWFGLLAPGRTPAPLVARIRADVHAALADPVLRQRLDGMAAMVVDDTPEAFSAFIAAEIPRMAEVLRKAGMTAAP